MRDTTDDNGNGNGGDGFSEEPGGERDVAIEKEAASGSAAPTYPPCYDCPTDEKTMPTDAEREIHKANAGGI
jgi:hypothetical protein